ncbi:MAG: hypothetical protein IV100_18990 [Myxococcales bacterium]|nr:hypothetical protein [Myxococcales bacterium]
MIPWTPIERRWRDALLHAIVPASGRGLPALADLDLRPFWARFDEVAPPHLQLGLRAAAVVLGGLLPRLLAGRPLASLPEADQERLLLQLASLPGGAQLVDLAKVVAGLAYFSVDAVEDIARSRS